MNIVKYIYLIVSLLTLVSCSDTTDNTSKVETLQDAIQRMSLVNTRQLNSLQYKIMEKGNRQADVDLLKNLKTIIIHPSFSGKRIATDALETAALFQYADQLLSAAQTYEWDQRKSVDWIVEHIQSSKDIFLEKGTPLDYYFLKYNVITLQKAFVDDVSAQVGMDIIDGGILYMHYQSDTLKADQPFKAVITMDEPVDEEFFEIGEGRVQVLNTTEEFRDYSLEYVGKGGWIITFTPLEKGPLTFKFGALVHSRINRDNPGYPYYIERQFYVE